MAASIMPGHVTSAVPRSSPRSGLDQACGGVVRHRKVLPTRLSRLSKFPRMPNGCGQLVQGHVVQGKWPRLSEQAIIIANAVFVFITAK
jgi:hypothetical protein